MLENKGHNGPFNKKKVHQLLRAHTQYIFCSILAISWLVKCEPRHLAFTWDILKDKLCSNIVCAEGDLKESIPDVAVYFMLQNPTLRNHTEHS